MPEELVESTPPREPAPPVSSSARDEPMTVESLAAELDTARAERDAERLIAEQALAGNVDPVEVIAAIVNEALANRRAVEALEVRLRTATTDALNAAADEIQAMHPGEVKASVEFLRARAATTEPANQETNRDA